jgi:hypothetical protein
MSTRLISTVVPCIAAAAIAALPAMVQAHFLLLEPVPTLVQNQLGDPQKLGPCGGTTANAGTPTQTVSKVKGGTPLHLTIRETVFHPGHYRVALVVNALSDLPADPTATTRDTERGPYSVATPIQNPIAAPLLADGLFPHTTRPTDLWQMDLPMPNITCKKCSLQVTQFMAEHGVNKDGGFYYHHCAELEITADPDKPVDTRWPAQSTQ